MIEKKRWLLITFHTTSEAMAMEQRCQEAGLAGRLIPVPRTITADCGLAWRAELSLRPQLEALTQSMQSRDGAVFCVYAPLLPLLEGKGLFSK